MDNQDDIHREQEAPAQEGVLTDHSLAQSDKDTQALAKQLIANGGRFAGDHLRNLRRWIDAFSPNEEELDDMRTRGELDDATITLLDEASSGQMDFTVVFVHPVFEKKNVFMEFRISKDGDKYIVADFLWQKKGEVRIHDDTIDMERNSDGVLRAEGVMQIEKLTKRGRYMNSTYRSHNEVVKHCLRSVERMVSLYEREDRESAQQIELNRQMTKLNTATADKAYVDEFFDDIRGKDLAVVVLLASKKSKHSKALWQLADEMAQTESQENVYNAIISVMRGNKSFSNKAAAVYYHENFGFDADCYFESAYTGGLKDLRYERGQWKAIYIDYGDTLNSQWSQKREFDRKEVDFATLNELILYLKHQISVDSRGSGFDAWGMY